MNARERMLAAINHERPDRIPTDIWATPEVRRKLQGHFGDETDVNAALHIDGIASVWPRYVGPGLPEVGEGESVDYWGIRSKLVDYGTGKYSEMTHHPLAEAETIDGLEQYEWPRADWFDYSQMREQACQSRERQVVMCGYMAIFFQHNKLRGLQQSLMDPLLEPDYTHHLLGRISDFLYEQHRRAFEACGEFIDVSQVTDDFGTQTGPMISIEVFEEFYKPHMQRFIDLVHEFDIKVFHHDDGAIRPFIPHFVEMGVEILNPIQWTCPGMELEGLKRDFGSALCFHGGIDNQRILPFGTPDEVRAEVRHNIDILGRDGTGYILAPCHAIQAVSPVENIIAMYDEAWNYGKL